MKLVLAEKPSVAQSIAKVLGANERCEGYLEGNGYMFFKVMIEKKGFYCSTNPFDGQYYEYNEIVSCRRIKKVVRTSAHYYEAAQRRYYFFFEFTDVRGKTRKFQFEDPIHGHEVDVLKERIENAQL